MASGSGSNKIKIIRVDADFQKELLLANDVLVVADFFALWCDPCKKIAPVFEEFSKKYSSAIFIKVDIDTCSNTVRRYDVKSLPTFVFFHKRKMLDKVRGADEKALEAGIVKHLANVGGNESQQSKTSTVSAVPGQINLVSTIDMSNSECLNQSDRNPFKNALTNGSSYLESDCDEQLIIALAFTQPVKLHSIQIVAPQDGTAPKNIKLFVNQTYTLDFDSAEANAPVQSLELTNEDVKEDSIMNLSYLKFQNVQHLTIFIKDNQGGAETTVINRIGLYGNLLDSTNMREFKRVSGDKGERH